MIPLIIVALVILMIIAPQYKKWAFLGIVIALVTGGKNKPGTNADADDEIPWISYEHFADNDFLQNIRSNSKLAKAITICFAHQLPDFGMKYLKKIVEEVDDPQEFAKAMVTPVDYFRNRYMYGLPAQWVSESTTHLIYPINVLFMVLEDNIVTATSLSANNQEALDLILAHQEAAKNYLRLYFRVLKQAELRPASNVMFSLHQHEDKVKELFKPNPWAGRSNIFVELRDIHELWDRRVFSQEGFQMLA